MNDEVEIHGIFPCPVYGIDRDSEFDETEEKEIKDIIEEGVLKNKNNLRSKNSYIFNDNFKKIKQFCEHHIKIYVEQIINPKKEIDFYITQSWLNITRPGGRHHEHSHPNSIISGVFYVSTEKDDTITFSNPNNITMDCINFEEKEYNMWNSTTWYFPVYNNLLVLFPSWLIHQVEPNKNATQDRLSISFNTFVRGNLGKQENLTELIL